MQATHKVRTGPTFCVGMDDEGYERIWIKSKATLKALPTKGGCSWLFYPCEVDHHFLGLVAARHHAHVHRHASPDVRRQAFVERTVPFLRR